MKNLNGNYNNNYDYLMDHLKFWQKTTKNKVNNIYSIPEDGNEFYLKYYCLQEHNNICILLKENHPSIKGVLCSKLFL